MTAYVELQEAEFAAESRGYTATRHQREVGTGYFDLVDPAISPQRRDRRAGRLDRDRAVPLRVKSPRNPASTANRKTGMVRKIPGAGSGGVVGR